MQNDIESANKYINRATKSDPSAFRPRQAKVSHVI